MSGSYHVLTTKLTPFVVRNDEWGTKKGTGKPTTLHVQWYGKGISWYEVTSNNKKKQARNHIHCQIMLV